MSAPMLPDPLTEQAEEIDQVWTLFLYGAIGVFLFITVLVVWCVVRYRRRDDRLPPQVRLNVPIELTYTIVPLVVVIVLFFITLFSVRSVDAVAEDDEIDLFVEVTGFRWQWRFEYPDLGVVVSGSEQEVPELVLPTSSTVRFEVTSVDVVHSFWIPGFRFKRDMFPDQVSTVDVDMADITGEWPAGGVCSEFCGLDHHKMYFDLRVVSPEEFEQWAAEAAEAEP